MGARIKLPESLSPHAWLFSETHARYLLSIKPEDQDNFEQLTSKHRVKCEKIGVVGGNRININTWLDLAVDNLDDIYYNVLDKAMEG